MKRDIFGKLLAITTEKKIDMEICLSYPLSPAPPAFCHCTEEMYKTEKSILAKKLISKIEPSIPTQIDIDIIDGFHFLHLLGPSVPQTFEKISKLKIKKICNTSVLQIHIVFEVFLFVN